MDWDALGKIALTALVLGVPTSVVAVCAAISQGDTPVVKFLGQTALFLLGLSLSLGLLLGLHAIWTQG
jgi:hypothetical protein